MKEVQADQLPIQPNYPDNNNMYYNNNLCNILFHVLRVKLKTFDALNCTTIT